MKYLMILAICAGCSAHPGQCKSTVMTTLDVQGTAVSVGLCAEDVK